MYELPRTIPDVKMLLARAMESAADFKSCKAQGVIARCPLTVQQGFPVASYKAFRGPPASCKLLKFQLTAHNPKVGGSNPPPATNLNLHKDNHWTGSRQALGPFDYCLFAPRCWKATPQGQFH